VKDERVYFGHIRDAINDIEQYTSLGREAFVAERARGLQPAEESSSGHGAPCSLDLC
jgi:hypothetical protein